jgi:hypothetical protein
VDPPDASVTKEGGAKEAEETRRARVVAAVRAGALAAGGSLAALAGAIWLGAYYLSFVFERDHAIDLDLGPSPRHLGRWMAGMFAWRAHRLPLVVWVGGTLVAALVAVLVGYPGAARGACRWLQRALGVGVFGPLFAAPVVLVAAATLTAAPLETDTDAWILLVAGLLLAVLFWLLRPAARLVVDERPEVQGGLLPQAEDSTGFGETPALAVTGPPITAAESERAALAVEVRVLWGGDLLHVDYLDPPRDFHVGGEADLIDIAGTGRRLLVRVQSGAVSVVAPRAGADVEVVTASTRHPIERAEEVRGAPFEGGATDRHIPLPRGTKVTLALRGATGGTAYRAAGGEASTAGGAPLVIEVALVPAGRVVGRGVSLRGHGRAAAIMAMVATLAGGGLALPAWDEATTYRDPEENETEVVLAVQEAMATVRQYHPEIEPEPEPTDPDADVPLLNRRPHRTRWDVAGPVDNPPPASEMEHCEPGMQWRPGGCWGHYDHYFGVINRFGLGVSGVPLFTDLAWRDPRDAWEPFPAYPRRDVESFGRSGPAPRAKVHVGTVAVTGKLPLAVAARVLRSNTGRARACYEEGLRRNPNLQGQVPVTLVVGVDGGVELRPQQSTLPDDDVVSCIRRGYLGAPFPAPEATERGIVVVTGTLFLSP